MVDFRRCITALAVLALFAGLAVAQTGSVNSPLNCATNVTVTPLLRGEGFTEQTGDITLVCTGGTPTPLGQQIPQVNITVFYGTQVTSRLFSNNPNISEALLMIDEPGSGLTAPVVGFGPAAGQNVCTTPTTGCVEFVNTLPSTGTPSIQTPVAVDTVNATTAGKNVFQGIVAGNSVTFFGIPVLAPGTTSSRVYRITNVRVNATTLQGSLSGSNPVTASISISGATSLLISNATPFVGFVSPGLSASVSGGATGDTQCNSQTKQVITTLRFSELFGTAFKTRVAATSTTTGQTSTPPQNIPGGIFNSESNFVLPIPGAAGSVAGLADFGTRLKAVFNNVPKDARIFVSTANVLNNVTPPIVPSPVGGSVANGGSGTNTVGGNYVGYAQLVTNETASDGGVSGVPAATKSDSVGSVDITEIPISGGTGQAVWEVINTNPNTNETFQFAVYVTFTANVAGNSPAPTGVNPASVNLSFAPSPPAFSAGTGSNARSDLTIPRFAPDSSAARPILSITVCRTILLYPYVLNQIGLDTGIAIANTSQDPFTSGSSITGSQSGTCRLTFYGATPTTPTTAPPFFDTTTIVGGTVYGNTISTMAPNFTGYVIAVCNFQFAHGFAFISDIGIRNISMGYLAVVLDDPGTGLRNQTNTKITENGGN